MLLTRFLQCFARVEAPMRPAKIRFLLHDSKGEPFALANVRSITFTGTDATWTVNLTPGMKVATVTAETEPIQPKPGEKPH